MFIRKIDHFKIVVALPTEAVQVVALKSWHPLEKWR